MRANEERETVTLIGSDKVEGTAVYPADDKQIGLIERDHDRQAVRSLIRSFGGFLGIGDDCQTDRRRGQTVEPGVFGGEYETGMSSRGPAALRFGRPMSVTGDSIPRRRHNQVLRVVPFRRPFAAMV